MVQKGASTALRWLPRAVRSSRARPPARWHCPHTGTAPCPPARLALCASHVFESNSPIIVSFRSVYHHLPPTAFRCRGWFFKTKLRCLHRDGVVWWPCLELVAWGAGQEPSPSLLLLPAQPGYLIGFHIFFFLVGNF